MANCIREERKVLLEALCQPGLSFEGGEGGMKCALCEREAAADLCRYHAQAKASIEAAFSHWKRAYGTLEWTDYLDRIKRNPRTGQWAKEAAGFLGDFSDKKSS